MNKEGYIDIALNECVCRLYPWVEYIAYSTTFGGEHVWIQNKDGFAYTVNILDCDFSEIARRVIEEIPNNS